MIETCTAGLLFSKQNHLWDFKSLTVLTFLLFVIIISNRKTVVFVFFNLYWNWNQLDFTESANPLIQNNCIASYHILALQTQSLALQVTPVSKVLVWIIPPSSWCGDQYSPWPAAHARDRSPVRKQVQPPGAIVLACGIWTSQSHRAPVRLLRRGSFSEPSCQLFNWTVLHISWQGHSNTHCCC